MKTELVCLILRRLQRHKTNQEKDFSLNNLGDQLYGKKSVFPVNALEQTNVVVELQMKVVVQFANRFITT